MSGRRSARGLTVTGPACGPHVMASFLLSLGADGPVTAKTAAGTTDKQRKARLQLRNIEQGRRLCSVCPILARCRAVALDPREDLGHGMVAGMTRSERHRLRQRGAA